MYSHPMAQARRTKAAVESDRRLILLYVERNTTGSPIGGRVWVKQESWMRASDVAALVAEGKLGRDVRKEWDRGTGHQHAHFGGASVMIRHRAYLRLPEAV